MSPAEVGPAPSAPPCSHRAVSHHPPRDGTPVVTDRLETLPRSASFGRTPRELADLPAAGDLRSLADLFDDEEYELDGSPTARPNRDHAADEETTMTFPEVTTSDETAGEPVTIDLDAGRPVPPVFPEFSLLVESTASDAAEFPMEVAETPAASDRDILAEFGLHFEVPTVGHVDDGIRPQIEGGRRRHLAHMLGVDDLDEPPASTNTHHDLDGAIEALRLIPVSDARAVSLLPDDALAVPLFPGVVGAVAVVRDGAVDYVSEERVNEWGITVSMAVSLAESNTRSTADLRRSTVDVHGAEVVVIESDVPIAMAALCWGDDITGTALPVGSLVVAASSRLVLVQPGPHRSPEVVDTLLAFARQESIASEDTIEPALFLNSLTGLSLAGQLNSAAARLGVAATIDRLTGV